ncbi:MAG: isocitrate/isopropylmalate family dehydrogenase, partial [Actinomycetota bacterium]
ANPIAMILSTGMMLRHLGERPAADAVDRAVDDVLRAGAVRTRDLGGSATTAETAAAVAHALRTPGPPGTHAGRTSR